MIRNLQHSFRTFMNLRFVQNHHRTPSYDVSLAFPDIYCPTCWSVSYLFFSFRKQLEWGGRENHKSEYLQTSRIVKLNVFDWRIIQSGGCPLFRSWEFLRKFKVAHHPISCSVLLCSTIVCNPTSFQGRSWISAISNQFSDLSNSRQEFLRSSIASNSKTRPKQQGRISGCLQSLGFQTRFCFWYILPH